MEATVEQDIKGLVEEYVAAHPTSGGALSRDSLCFCAGRLLLLQAGKLQLQTEGTEQHTLLAACLYVLFVQEHLERACTSILGVDADLIFETLCRAPEPRSRGCLSPLVSAYPEVDGTWIEPRLAESASAPLRTSSRKPSWTRSAPSAA